MLRTLQAGSVLAALMLSLAPHGMTQSFSPAITKLHGRANPANTFSFGQAVACSGRYLLVGEPGNDEAGNNAGAAHVFDAVSGRYLRKLVAPDSSAGKAFGYSVALDGTRAILGATGDNTKGSGAGAAYIFDLVSGKQLFKLTVADGVATDQFGWAVAISGGVCAVSAVSDDDKGADSGSVYLFNATTGAPVVKLTASDGASNDFFGYSLSMGSGLVVVGSPFDTDTTANQGSVHVYDAGAATGLRLRKLLAPDPFMQDGFGISVSISGHLVLVGALADDDQGENSGSAYVMDARTGGLINKLTALDGSGSDQFGNAVALSGQLALIASPIDGDKGSGSGSVYLFDVIRDQQLAKITAPDGRASAQFGVWVALSGNLALVGANGDNDLGSGAGAAYRISPVTGPLPLSTVAAKGSSAPGTVEARFSSFGRDAFINSEGETSFLGGVAGIGAGGGRASGVWDTQAPGKSLDLALRSRDGIAPGIQIAALLSTYCNNNDNVLIQATLSGSGITAANNRVLMRDNGVNVVPMLRTGDQPGMIFSGGRLQSFLHVAQSAKRDRVSISGQLRKGTGSPVVTAADDSAIFFVNHLGAPIGEVYREGAPVGGGTFGQLFPRLTESADSTFVGFASWVVPFSGPAVQRLFAPDHTVVPLFFEAAQEGNAPGTGMPAAKYGSFLAETMSSSGFMAFRASLKGTGVTSGNNEGLWHTNGYRMVVRKGDDLDASDPTVVVSRILQFWAARSGASCFFLVSLKGPKVTAKNDLALYHWNESNGTVNLQRLMREGDSIEGPNGDRVGVIQRVDVEQTGRYVILASLTGSAATNQALFAGRVDVGNGTDLSGLRLPGLRLRKGKLHAAPGAIARTLRSLTLSPVTDAGGAGGKGQGQVLGAGGNVVLKAQFDNQAQEVLAGGL